MIEICGRLNGGGLLLLPFFRSFYRFLGPRIESPPPDDTNVRLGPGYDKKTGKHVHAITRRRVLLTFIAYKRILINRLVLFFVSDAFENTLVCRILLCCTHSVN